MRICNYDALIDELVACFNRYKNLDADDRKEFYKFIGYFFNKIDSAVHYDRVLLNHSECFGGELHRGTSPDIKLEQYRGSDWIERIDVGIPPVDRRPFEEFIHKERLKNKPSEKKDETN